MASAQRPSDSSLSPQTAVVNESDSKPGDVPEAPSSGSLSIIIPAWNEADRIEAVIQHVLACGGPSVQEVIVVDGESNDATATLAARAGAMVITSRPGRGLQMNAGAAAASGAALLFLHADTRLPQRFARHVQRVLDRPGVIAGAFRFKVDAPQRSFRLIERLVLWRSVRRQLPYGDQAIFMTRDAFNAVDGYPDAPVMEDYAMMRRLRKRGRIAIAPAPAVTSARRWLRCGIWRTTLMNQLTIVAYHMRVPVSWIAAYRQRKARRCQARSLRADAASA